jgi:hypothetical protein
VNRSTNLTGALDLRTRFPRSPKERLGPYAHLARMIDKARAKAADTIGDYIYPCPLDQLLLDFLEIDSEAFFAAAKALPDHDVLRWVEKHAAARSARDVQEWNEAFLNRKPKDEDSLGRFLEIRNRVAPQRTDVTTWVDLLDLEEGR